MNAAALLLALAVPAAPAPKGALGLARELIDLLPEDTAAVLVADVRRAEKSEIGKAFLKALADEQPADEPIRVDDLVRDVDLVLVGQFLIDDGTGDFCFILRLREGSRVPKALTAVAEKGGAAGPEKIGKRTVYSIKEPSTSFTIVDDRTVMIVLAAGNEKQTKETRDAAYGEREKPGPSLVLRKMLAEEPADAPAIRLYGHHPKKLAHSASIALVMFGPKYESIAPLGEKLVSYRGGVSLGLTGDLTIRVACRDADTAKALLAAYDEFQDNDPVVKEFRATGKAVRDGDEVIYTGKVTRALIERIVSNPNK